MYAGDSLEARFVKLFRMLAPDLANATDDMVLAMMGLCQPMINKERFGDLYGQALVYLVAHRLSLTNIIASSGATSTELIAGNVVAEKEGDLARSFSSGGGNSTGTIGYVDNLDKTSYGLEFKRIRDMCIVTIATRFG